MKNLFYLFFPTMLVFACGQKMEVKNLSGYWEIDKVVMQDGSKRNYEINTTIDYIEMENDSSGFRKKLTPRFDGTFETTNDFESFIIKQKDSKIYLHYTTPLMQWKEQLLKLTEDRLEVKNDNSIRYIYKRFTPIFIK